MSWVLNLALIYLALMVVPRLIGRFRVWLLVKEIRLREPEIEVASLEDIPGRQLPFFQFSRTRLPAELPFVHRGTIRIRQELPDSLERWFDLYVSYDGRTIATVGANYVPSIEPFQVVFGSTLQSGQRLETVNWIGHLQMETNSDISDACADDLSTHFQRHLQRIVELPPDSLLNFSNYAIYDLMELEKKEAMAQHVMLIENGTLQGSRHGVFRFSSQAVWQLTQKIIKGEKAIGAIMQSRALERETEAVVESTNAETNSVVDARVLNPTSPEADLADFARQKETALAVASRRSLTTKWLILIFSAIAFFLTFGFWLGFTMSALLLAVVFVHELGHISAMALFGYRNRQVLFIPFFGAAAIGEKNEAPAWQQLVVLFMGPMPGILVGIGCLFYALYELQNGRVLLERGSLYEQIVSLTLVLNYLNLVPLGFLDGGKIVQVLFFTRFVRARFVFQVFSAIAFAGFAFALQSWILGLIAAVSFLALPSLWRFGTLLKNLELSFENLSTDHELSKYEKRLQVFRVLRQPPYLHWNSRDRHETAKQLIEYVETSRAGMATIIIGTVVYVFSVALPIVAFACWLTMRDGIPQ